MELTNLEKLKNLEKQSTYVFHGSENIIEEFEPRQAYTFIDGEKIIDGRPAIFASSFLDYAIFMSVINDVNCPKGFRSGCLYHENKLKFKATKETVDQLDENSKGYVYVFNKSDFEKRNESEYICYKKIKPVEKFEVNWDYFTKEIDIIEDDKTKKIVN